MTQKELIRQEIERQRNFIEGLFIEGDNSFYDGQDDAYNHLLAFIDSLPDENNPEPYNPVYDEEYLNEKIAKATKSWKGVDVNKMLADCRGYEEKPSDELKEAAWDCVLDSIDVNNPVLLPKYKELLLYLFIAGAEWQKEQQLTWKDIQDIVETAFWVIPQNIKESEKEEYYTKLLNEYQRIKKQNK